MLLKAAIFALHYMQWSFMNLTPTYEQMCALTGSWDGERDAGGRPRVPDAVLQALRSATVEHVWQVMKDHGYPPQFAGGFLQTRPGAVLVGRCVTAQFLPHRPDLDAAVRAAGGALGLVADAPQNAWVVDMLVDGDVMVADIFGKVREGTVIGDNLGSAIARQTRAGAIIDGGVRDLPGLTSLPEPFVVFYRGTDPTPIEDVVLGSFNAPVRIGEATVLPGDVALGTPAGVAFIPAHLAAEVARTALEIESRDTFSKQRLREGRYTTAAIDVATWPEEIEADYRAWLDHHGPGTT